MLDEIILGAKYFTRGFLSLKNPKLRHFIILPILINTLLFVGMLITARYAFNQLILWIDAYLPHWLHFLNWLLWIIFIVAAYLFIIYTFVLLANLVGSPFNSFLAEKVESLVTENQGFSQATSLDLIKDIPRVIAREFRKLIYSLPLLCLFLLLFIIPGINVIAGFAWFLFSAWMLVMQYIDYPMDNHKIPFKQMRQALAKRPCLALSFGAICLLFALIPVINFVLMPAAVIGATLMYVEQFASKNNCGMIAPDIT